MSGRLRRGLAVFVVAGVTLWPGAHHLLVRRHGMNPWELAGWAMYCVPVFPVEVRLSVDEGGRTRSVEFPADPRFLYRIHGFQKAEVGVSPLGEFLLERSILGSLRSPDDLAAVVAVAHPDAEAVTVEVLQRRFDPITARVRVDGVAYRYPVTDRAPEVEPGPGD